MPVSDFGRSLALELLLLLPPPPLAGIGGETDADADADAKDDDGALDFVVVQMRTDFVVLGLVALLGLVTLVALALAGGGGGGVIMLVVGVGVAAVATPVFGDAARLLCLPLGLAGFVDDFDADFDVADAYEYLEDLDEGDDTSVVVEDATESPDMEDTGEAEEERRRSWWDPCSLIFGFFVQVAVFITCEWVDIGWLEEEEEEEEGWFGGWMTVNARSCLDSWGGRSYWLAPLGLYTLLLHSDWICLPLFESGS